MNEIIQKYKVLIIGGLVLLFVGYILHLLLVDPARERRQEVMMEQWYSENGRYPTSEEYNNF